MRQFSNPRFLPDPDFTPSPLCNGEWFLLMSEPCCLGRHLTIHWVTTGMAVLMPGSPIPLCLLSASDLEPREYLYFLASPHLLLSLVQFRTSTHYFSIRISCFLLMTLHHCFKKENHKSHLWISLLCYAFCGLSSKNVWMVMAYVWCPSLFSVTGHISPYICILLLLILRLMMCSKGRESGVDRGRFLEENLIFRGLNFQSTNGDDWILPNIDGVLWNNELPQDTQRIQ